MLKIKIDTNNNAFQNGNRKVELFNILDDIKNKIKRGYEEGNIHDSNGNKVGSFELTNS